MAAIYPGKGLGLLTLGSSLRSVIAILKASPTTFPSISIIYSKKNPVKSPIIVVLKYNGLRLRFDGITQKLRLIEVIQWGKMKLTYKSRDLSGQGSPSYTRIYNDIFGPTFPGKYYHDHRLYILSYPGIAFSFNISPNAVKKLDPTQDIPRLLMSPNAPPCSAMAIFQGEFWWDVEQSLFPKSDDVSSISPGTKPLQSASDTLKTTSIDTVSIDEVQGTAVVHFASHSKSLSSFCINLNKTTMQDVIMNLGPPSERFYKEDSRLTIFNPVDGSEESERATLFFNYFAFGMDICFDTSKKNATVKKIIFHGNLPGSVSFQKYERCRWKISKLTHEADSAQMDNDSDDSNSESNDLNHTQLPNSEMKFRHFAHLYSFKKEPVLLNRRLECGTGILDDDGMEIIENDDEDMISGVSHSEITKPLNSKVSDEDKADQDIDLLAKDKLEDWGLAELYGAPGLVVEVLKNGDISSITLY